MEQESRWTEKVKGMLSALQKCDDEVKAQAALPKKVKLERYTLEDEKLILYYNAAYGKMDTVREVLCRAALVRSLTQIDGVDLVMICVDGTPLTDKKREYLWIPAGRRFCTEHRLFY